MICTILFRTNLLWLGINIRFYFQAQIGRSNKQGPVLEIATFIWLYSLVSGTNAHCCCCSSIAFNFWASSSINLASIVLLSFFSPAPSNTVGRQFCNQQVFFFANECDPSSRVKRARKDTRHAIMIAIYGHLFGIFVLLSSYLKISEGLLTHGKFDGTPYHRNYNNNPGNRQRDYKHCKRANSEQFKLLALVKLDLLKVWLLRKEWLCETVINFVVGIRFLDHLF